MTDKERLEELEEIVKFQIDNDSHYGRPANVILNGDDVKWLIKQAERVQELEDEYRVRQTEYLEEHIDRLEKVNKRYREVVTQAISDLENECLWDALVKLKALEEDLK